MNMKKVNLILAFFFFTVLSACGQSQSTGKVVPGSSEDVKKFPEAKPNPTGKRYCQRMLTTSW